MASLKAPARAEEASIHAVIHRADGTVVDLGVVSYYHRRWYRRWLWNIKQAVKGVTRKWQVS
jgi:hypothetical protein